MSEIDVRSIVLFFYFASLDERLATEATADTVEFIRRGLAETPQTDLRVLTITSINRVWKKKQADFRSPVPFEPETSEILLSADLDSWIEFRQKAPEKELVSFVFSRLLKFSDREIALGLGISIGTHRYRTARSLRRMGVIVDSHRDDSPRRIVRA